MYWRLVNGELVMSWGKSFKVLSVTGILLIVIVGCTREVPVEVIKEVTVEKTTTVKKEAIKDKEPGKLVVYSGRSKSLIDPIINQFQEATGIDVSVKYGKTAQIAATLLEEGNNSPADLFFAQDPGGLGATIDMLAPLPAEIVGLVPGWARSPEDRWVGISGRARVVVYNTENISESDLPTSIKGFVDPKWEGRIGWPPTNSSFQAMVTAMRVQWTVLMLPLVAL